MSTESSDRRPEWPGTVYCGRSVRGLLPLLEGLPRLSDHPNRALQTRDALVAHLLAFFDPTLRSLRLIEDFSATRQARRYLAIPRLPKSTLADFHRLADPGVLAPIVAHLLGELGRRGRATPAGLPESLGRVLAVDGTFLALAADVAWAVHRQTKDGRHRRSARLDVHLDVAAGLPRVVAVHGSEASEPAAAAGSIQPGAVHVYDRGFFDFALIGRHLAISAEVPTPFVMRMRAPGPRTPKFARGAEKPPGAQDAAAGVLSDHTGHLAGSRRRAAPAAMLREVVIASPGEPGGTIHLLTDLLEVPARVVGTLYRYRWQVELFFRWLKATAHFRHLLSQRREAIAFEVHVAVIGALLLALRYDARPSRYAYALLHQVSCGAASAEEVLPIMAERERRSALEREGQRRRRERAAGAREA